MNEQLHEHEVESLPKIEEQQPEHVERTTERAEVPKGEELDVEETRQEIKKIHEHLQHRGEAEQHSQKYRAPAQAPASLFNPSHLRKQNLNKIRRHLTESQRRFSIVIHTNSIRTVSEATAASLARPYAMLAAGVVACAGSLIYFYLTRHLGYSYNFFVTILLFGVGLVAGLVVEFFYKGFHKSRG